MVGVDACIDDGDDRAFAREAIVAPRLLRLDHAVARDHIRFDFWTFVLIDDVDVRNFR